MYVQADLRLCWSHIPHCWKYDVSANLLSKNQNKLVIYSNYDSILVIQMIFLKNYLHFKLLKCSDFNASFLFTQTLNVSVTATLYCSGILIFSGIVLKIF